MLHIYLTRHGQDTDNVAGALNGHRDTTLTEKGIDQARVLADKLRAMDMSFDAVYSSPLARAFDTAQLISQTLHAPPPIKEQLLIERDFGMMTGKDISTVEDLCSPDVLKTDVVTYFLNAENVETFPDLLQRIRILLDTIRERHTSGNILLVTHGDTGKMIYAAYYNLDWQSVLKQFHFGNCDLLLLSEESVAEDAHVFESPQYNH